MTELPILWAKASYNMYRSGKVENELNPEAIMVWSFDMKAYFAGL